MICKCPQCGKPLEISNGELARNSCRVVCPQCLADFEPEGIDRRAIEALTAKEPEPEPQHCIHCGHSLPAAGLPYCPWCGKPLDAEPISPASTPKPEPIERPAEPVSPAEPPSQAETPETTTRPPLFMPYRLGHVTEQPASPLFRRVCYVIILLLIAAWVAMVCL